MDPFWHTVGTHAHAMLPADPAHLEEDSSAPALGFQDLR